MASAPYLIALALLEQNGRRALPLQGRSLHESIPAEADPGAEGHAQALELLVRIWQRSEDGPLCRAAADSSLLLVELPMEALMEQLPPAKAAWIANGDTAGLQRRLQELGGRLWSLSLEHRSPLHYSPIL
jgi:hypothetical protein